MGGIITKFSKPVKNFNVENRAYRELEKQMKSTVGKAAPTHASFRGTEVDERQIDMADFAKKEQKNETLIERIGQMDINAKEERTKVDKRPLPTMTQSPPDHEYGFHIPAHVPKGKVTLPQALTILRRYEDEHPRYTIQAISTEYGLSHSKVVAIVEHFQMLNVFLPKKALKDASESKLLQKVSPTMLAKLTTVKREMDNTAITSDGSDTNGAKCDVKVENSDGDINEKVGNADFDDLATEKIESAEPDLSNATDSNKR